MKKNGFTLIELLGVIILIAIISFVSFPSILNKIKESKNFTSDSVDKLILNAAKVYLSEHVNDFEKNSDYLYNIKIEDLINDNYIDKDVVGDNYNDKIVNVTYSGIFNYAIGDKNKSYVCNAEAEVSDNNAGRFYNKDDSENPNLTLNLTPNKYDTGVRFRCKTDSQSYDKLFYIISSNNSTVDLISSFYLDETSAYSTGTNENGPVSALEVLNRNTDNWNLNVSMPTLSQIKNGGTLYTGPWRFDVSGVYWISDNDSDNIDITKAYAFIINDTQKNIILKSVTEPASIRPVITLTKSQLSFEGVE